MSYRDVWNSSELSDMSAQINEAARRFADDKSKLIEKTLKKYCRKYGCDYEGVLRSGLLSMEDHPNREFFMLNNVCIFYIKRTEEEFNNDGCFGTKVTYEFVEKF